MLIMSRKCRGRPCGAFRSGSLQIQVHPWWMTMRAAAPRGSVFCWPSLDHDRRRTLRATLRCGLNAEFARAPRGQKQRASAVAGTRSGGRGNCVSLDNGLGADCSARPVVARSRSGRCQHSHLGSATRSTVSPLLSRLLSWGNALWSRMAKMGRVGAALASHGRGLRLLPPWPGLRRMFAIAGRAAAGQQF